MFKNFHFQKRLFLITAALFLITILFIFLGFSYFIVRDTDEKSKDYFINKAEKGRQGIEQFVNNMKSISMQIVANNTIQNTYLIALESDDVSIKYFDIYPEEKRKIRKECAAINNITDSVQKIYIYTKPHVFFSYNSHTLDYNYIQQAMLQKKVDRTTWEDKNYYLLSGPHKDSWSEDDSLVISLYRPLITTYSTNEKIAMIEIENSYTKLEKAIDSKEFENINLILVDKDTQSIVYPYNTFDASTEEYYIAEGQLEEEGVTIKENQEGIKHLLYKASISDSSWQIVVSMPYSSYTAQSKNMVMLLVLFFVICVIVVGFGIYMTTIKLSLPIIELRESLNEITFEKLAISKEFHSNNEIELLKDKFNAVLQALRDSIKKLDISQAAEYEAKIRSLQAQINPHFLYNSLMAISAAGQEADNEKVQDMCAQLSSLFRYSYSDDSVSTIRDEISNITTYLEFMKCRYLEDLHYEIVDNLSIQDTFIPKLLLQPLIENCFTHGFRSVRPPLYIKVSCEREEQGWSITIKDNGGGFSKEMYQILIDHMSKIDEDFKKDIYGISVDTKNHALLNVYIRLKATYSEKAFMSIGNGETGGAVIIIKGGITGDNNG